MGMGEDTVSEFANATWKPEATQEAQHTVLPDQSWVVNPKRKKNQNQIVGLVSDPDLIASLRENGMIIVPSAAKDRYPRMDHGFNSPNGRLKVSRATAKRVLQEAGLTGKRG